MWTFKTSEHDNVCSQCRLQYFKILWVVSFTPAATIKCLWKPASLWKPISARVSIIPEISSQKAPLCPRPLSDISARLGSLSRGWRAWRAVWVDRRLTGSFFEYMALWEDMCLEWQERLWGPHTPSTPVMDASLSIGGFAEHKQIWAMNCDE